MIASAGSQEVVASRSLEHPGEAAVECGIAIEADVELMLASEPLFLRLSGQIGDALGRQLPVSVLLTGLQGDNAASRFEGFCRRLADALDAPGAHTSLLEITISGKDPEPGFAMTNPRAVHSAQPALFPAVLQRAVTQSSCGIAEINRRQNFRASGDSLRLKTENTAGAQQESLE